MEEEGEQQPPLPLSIHPCCEVPPSVQTDQ
jgi:hypothetical protein